MPELLNDQFLLRVGYRFVGNCGFFRLGFGQPRVIGQDPQENAFALTGLTPGKYLIQALPVFQGGFSSPVRSTLGLIPLEISGLASSGYHHRRQHLPAFFPNPQSGEFYNGPATGCGTDLTPVAEKRLAALLMIHSSIRRSKSRLVGRSRTSISL